MKGFAGYSILNRAWHRYLLDYPGQLILSILGVSLGIAVVVSIDLAKQSALDAFIQATETISGDATYRIVGDSGLIDENLYAQLRLGDFALRFSPKIEGYVKIENPGAEKIRILGVDPFSELGFGSFEALDSMSVSENERRNLARILTRPGYVIISKSTAARLNLNTGENLEVIGGGHRKKLRIAAQPEFSEPFAQQAMEDLILTDIASAQEILEVFGRINHIDVQTTDSESDLSALESLKKQLPDHVELVSYQRINRNAQELTASFYTNLTALSLLSLVVGMFLIYNTINFLTIRRRGLIGMLRALGTSRRQIFRLVIVESALIGLIGTIAGLLAGTLLAHALLDMIGNTINNVYFPLPTPKLQWSLGTILQGLLLGTAVSVITALLPAKAAIAVEPVQAMTRSKLESNTKRHALYCLLAGLLLLTAGASTTLLSGKSVTFGFAGLMLLVVGCALLTPFFVILTSGLAYPVVARIFGMLGSLPFRSLNANPSRSGLAVAALMVAISTTVGVQIMVASFRDSVRVWLEHRLSADLYISSMTSQAAAGSSLNDDFLFRLSGIEGVRSTGGVLRRVLQSSRGADHLSVVTLKQEVRNGFDFISKTPKDIWSQLDKQDTVIVTESYAYRHGIKPGAVLDLPADRGTRKFQVVGIYQDYNPGPGMITMGRSTYQKHWSDNGYSAISIYTMPGTDLKRLQREVLALNKGGLVLEMTERTSILSASLAVFNQAFAVTDILQWLAATVAFLGVFSVLTAIQLDRIREYGVLRSLGITSRQLAMLISAESGLMGSIAGLLAIPVGLMIAIVLIYVINQRSYGWSVGFAIPFETIVQGLSSGIIAALLAGLIPAYRMFRLQPAEALRSD